MPKDPQVKNYTRIIEGLTRNLFAMGIGIFAIFCVIASFYCYSEAKDKDIEKIRIEMSKDPVEKDVELYETIKVLEIAATNYSFCGSVLLAVGTSLLATLLFYKLYSGFLEKRILVDVTENTAKVAVDYANSLYSQRFDRIVPSLVFPATNSPMPEFQNHFNEVLKDSQIYNFKGEEGGFTVFRIQSLSDQGFFLDKKVILLVLDPREHELIRERAKIEIAVSQPTFSKTDLENKIAQIRRNIYATLVGIFDISHKARVEIGFHVEHLFFRSEIFDSGMFLTFYLGGEFPATYFYPRKTFIYQAFNENFRQIYKSTGLKLSFSTKMEDSDLKEKLDDLGCEFEISDLREFRDRLFNEYRNLLNKTIV